MAPAGSSLASAFDSNAGDRSSDSSHAAITQRPGDSGDRLVVLVPLALASLLTGLIQALASKWGVFGTPGSRSGS
jgi:hypothetical protein